MTRVATSFALSLWLGFHAVTGLSELAHLAGMDAIGGRVLEPAAGGTPAASLFVAALTLGTAGLLAVALCSLQGGTDRLRRRGERLSFAGIGIWPSGRCFSASSPWSSITRSSRRTIGTTSWPSARRSRRSSARRPNLPVVMT